MPPRAFVSLAPRQDESWKSPCSSDPSSKKFPFSLHIGPFSELSVLAYLQPLCTSLVGFHEAFCLEDFRRASKAPRIAGALRSDKTFPLGDDSQGGGTLCSPSSTSVTGFYFLALSWHISFWPPPLACSITFGLHTVALSCAPVPERDGYACCQCCSIQVSARHDNAFASAYRPTEHPMPVWQTVRLAPPDREDKDALFR